MTMKNLTLLDGTKMPVMGFGTWALRGDSGRKAIEEALALGYRHLDTADWYHNHQQVGEAMKAFGKRDEIYLVTKVYPPHLGYDTVINDTHQFLEELQTDTIDLLLIHWPGSTPVEETLRAMQTLQSEGVVRSMGISNFEGRQLDEVFALDFPIVNNQVEINTRVYPAETINTCQQKGVTVTAYSPLGEGGLLRNVKLVELAQTEAITTAQLVLAHLMTKNLVVIPRSGNLDHIKDNWNAIHVQLSDNTLKNMDALVGIA
jgi:2,5-diketo-D-gluconate reductase B